MAKVPGIKILIALPILFLVFLFILGRPWDNPSMKDYYFEEYQIQKVGVIENMELWKGCGLSIEFVNSKRKYISFKKDTAAVSIGHDCEVNEQIGRGDFFQKLPESNKCFIIRNDSVMLFDCNSELKAIVKEYKLPINNIDEWNLEEKYVWHKMPYLPIEKFLSKN